MMGLWCSLISTPTLEVGDCSLNLHSPTMSASKSMKEELICDECSKPSPCLFIHRKRALCERCWLESVVESMINETIGDSDD